MTGIRFAPGGPVLPFELITGQERGEVVFLCGAGVSMGPPIYLPGFAKLVREIYDDLGEDWMLHPPEKEGMDCPPQYLAPDRTLNALFKRLAHQKPAIFKALRKALTTSSRGTKFHYNLLRLSRGIDNVRLVTTNFDTLFERSWQRFMSETIESHAAAGMPDPGSTAWKGVFHLHGRLTDPELEFRSDSQLVLTSAEFGDAYLRAGWASRYLYDLLRHATVVIIGYSLNDPPLRYLIDALDADRERFDFKALYAIAPVVDNDADGTSKIWAARGTIPLLYEPVNSTTGLQSHLALHRSIDGWAEYADDPTKWAKEKLKAHFRKSITDLSDEEWDEIDWVMGRSDNGRLLEEANPDSRWLDPLADRSKDLPSEISFSPWISRRLNDRDMMDAVMAKRGVLTPDACRHIEWTILKDPKALSATRRDFWFALMDTMPADRFGRGDYQYRLNRLLTTVSDTGFFTRKTIVDLFRPEMQLGKAWSTSGRRGRKLTDIAKVEFEPEGDLHDAQSIIKHWPPTKDSELAEDLSRELSAGLRQRSHLLRRTIPSVWELPSISDHPQNAHHNHGFAPMARLLVMLLERMQGNYPGNARAICRTWEHSQQELEIRLWQHALTLDALFGSRDVSEYLDSMSEERFWDVRYEREFLRLIRFRRNDIYPASWEKVEARLIEGPPQ